MQRSLVHAPFATVPFVNTTTYYPRQHRDMYPSVIVGDFNCEADATEIRFLKGLQSIDGRSAYFADAWERAGDGSDGATWTQRNAYSAAWPSDHFGVFAELQVRDQPC